MALAAAALAILPDARWSSPAYSDSVTTLFRDPGGPYEYVVPAGITQVHVRAIGGAGGSRPPTSPSSPLTSGGAGAVVEADLDVEPGQTIVVHVGGDGADNDSGNAVRDGGVNGGGIGLAGGGGGGSSDVRLDGGELTNRVLVAAGGGGVGHFAGQRGGDAGQAGDPPMGCPVGAAQPGTSSAGGAGGFNCSTVVGGNGELGTGGDGAVYSGGGGGGYYGGGGGGIGSGAGGSNYVVDTATNVVEGLNTTDEDPVVEITVVRLPQSVSFDGPIPSSGTVGGSAHVSATASSGLPTTVAVGPDTTSSACSVSDDVVSYDHAGTCQLIATQAGNDSYSPVDATISFNVWSAPSLSITTEPTIHGAAEVGRTLTVDPPTTSPSADMVTYRWYRGGRAVGGADADTYRLTAADLGEMISVQVLADRVGYLSDIRTSGRVGPVAPGSFNPGPAPSITGSAVIDETLTAHPGPIGPDPDQVSYQWYADDTPIEDATSPTLDLTRDQLGAAITVEVTARRAGYDDARATSDPFGPVTTGQPPTLTLRTTDHWIRRGEDTTLTWTSDDATALTASGAWPDGTGDLPTSGSLTIHTAKIGDHTYRIEATNLTGTTAVEITVHVQREPLHFDIRAPHARHRGQRLHVRTRGLDPGEPYTIRFAQHVVAQGRADDRGRVVQRITVPDHAHFGRTSVAVLGEPRDRVGHTVVRVRRSRH